MNHKLQSLIANPKQVRGVSANIITGACGGYFFNSLFDGHPEILPINIHAVTQEPENYYYYYIKRFPSQYKDVDFYTKCIDSWNLPSVYSAHFKCPQQAHLMRQAMRDGFVNLGEDFKYYHLYYLVYIGVAAACNYHLETAEPIIFQHRHIFYPHFYKEGYAHLDNSFYINYFRLVRHPEISLDRIFANTCADLRNLPGNTSCNYAYPFYLYYKDDLYKYFPKNKLFNIKFEDLHLKTEETLKACCQNLGIAYLPEVLLKSTIQGEKFVFTSSRSPNQISGFSEERGKDCSPKFLSKFQRLVIPYFFEKFYIRYGYKEKAELKYKALDLLFPLYFFILLLPTFREIKIFLAFYIYYFTPKKGTCKAIFSKESFDLLHARKIKELRGRISDIMSTDQKKRVQNLNNILSTMDRQQSFGFMALEKSNWEKKWTKSLKPTLFWLFFIPVFHFMYLKLKTAWFLIHYRFTSDEKLPPLINEKERTQKSVEQHRSPLYETSRPAAQSAIKNANLRTE